MLNDRDYMRSPNNMFRADNIGRKFNSWSAVKTLIVINIIVFFCQMIFVKKTVFRVEPYFTKQIVLSYSTVFGKQNSIWQIWRFFTYMFAHGNFKHIFFNMWGLFIFGQLVESLIGKKNFILLYVFSGLVAGVSWVCCNNSPVLGASGSVFGILVAAAMCFPNRKILLLFPPIPMKLKTFAVVYSLFELMLHFNSLAKNASRIAHLAHLGGALGGFLFIRFIVKKNAPTVSFFEDITNSISSLFNRARFKKHSGGTRNESVNVGDSRSVDAILDKISREGIASLTDAEKNELDQAKERLRQGNNL